MFDGARVAVAAPLADAFGDGVGDLEAAALSDWAALAVAVAVARKEPDGELDALGDPLREGGAVPAALAERVVVGDGIDGFGVPDVVPPALRESV